MLVTKPFLHEDHGRSIWQNLAVDDQQFIDAAVHPECLHQARILQREGIFVHASKTIFQRAHNFSVRTIF